MWIWLILCIWIALYSLRGRIHRYTTRPHSPHSLRISTCSIDGTTTALNELPQNLLKWLPTRTRSRGDRNRRLRLHWDLGAIFAIVAQIVSIAFLVYALLQAMTVLYTSTTKTTSPTTLVKRAPNPTSVGGESTTSNLLIHPLIPGLTTTFSAVPTLVLALVVAQLYHEFAHGLAAASESIPIVSTGFHLFFLIFPTFYVALADPSSSSSSPTFLNVPQSPQTQLRIASAGVWHNLGSAVLGWIASDEGWGVSTWVLERSLCERVEGGLIVANVQKNSPLFDLILQSSRITHLNDLELDSDSTSSSMSIWESYLSSSSSASSNYHRDFSNLGWCLPSRNFDLTSDDSISSLEKKDSCCSKLLDNLDIDANDSNTNVSNSTSLPETCFIDSDNPNRTTCTNLNDLLPPFRHNESSSSLTSRPMRCLDVNQCRGEKGEEEIMVCARIAPREEILRIGIELPVELDRIEAESRGNGMKKGRKKREKSTIIWKGSRENVKKLIRVTDLEPKYWFVPVGIEQTVSRFFSALFTFSLSLAFFNLLPLPHLDGQYILSSFLDSIEQVVHDRHDSLPLVAIDSPSSSNNRINLTVNRRSSRTRTSHGLLNRFVSTCCRTRLTRSIVEDSTRRRKFEESIQRFTIGVGSGVVGLTLVIYAVSYV